MKAKNKIYIVLPVLLLVVFLLAGIVYYRCFYNPYPEHGLLLEVCGIDAASVESVGVVNYDKLREAVSEEEVQALLTALNRSVSFQEKIRSGRNMLRSPAWRVEFFMKDGTVIRLEPQQEGTSAFTRIKLGEYYYRLEEEIALKTMEAVPETVASRYGPENRR